MPQLRLHGRLWLTLDGRNFFGRGRVELLERIRATGSIAQAARAMKMSYKAAWDAVDAMNNAWGRPLVESATGGKGGGGTLLTRDAETLIAAFRRWEEEHRRFLESLARTGPLPTDNNENAGHS